MLTQDDLLATLPPDRRDAVNAWLGRPLNTCSACGDPVLITQPRRIDKDTDGASMHHACS